MECQSQPLRSGEVLNFRWLSNGLVNLVDAMTGCIAAIKRPELFQHLFFFLVDPQGLSSSLSISEIEALSESMSKNYWGWVSDFAPIATLAPTFVAHYTERSLGAPAKVTILGKKGICLSLQLMTCS
ncbi:hypothetical protein Tsubulata_013761, partial [Turnera subulata]